MGIRWIDKGEGGEDLPVEGNHGDEWSSGGGRLEKNGSVEVLKMDPKIDKWVEKMGHVNQALLGFNQTI